MSSISRANVLLQFATLSLIVIVALGAGLGYLGQGTITQRIRDSAAATAAGTVRPPLEASLEGMDVRTALSGADYDAVYAAALPLISNQTVLVRLWSREARSVFSTADGDFGKGFLGHDELERAFEGATVHVVVPGTGTASDAPAPERVLQVFSPVMVSGRTPAAVMEVVQDYESTAALIERATTAFYVMLGAGLALAWVTLQGVAWWFASRVTRRYSRLAYLFQIGQRFRSSLDLSEVVAEAARDAAILGQSQYGFVCLMDSNRRELVLRATYDHEKGATGQYNRTVDEGYLLRAVATGKAQSARLPERPLRVIFGIRANEGPAVLASVPMRLRDRVVGVTAAVRHPSVHDFSASEIEALQELADQAAMAIEQAGLFQKVRTYAEDLEMSYDTTLRALMAALDTKDAATEGHSERVARLTVAVAREMQLPEERMLDIERGALLHDLGKIGVPDSVLRKPESLNKEEWKSMQQHPLLAALMVSKVGFLEGAMPILLYHHERFDGSGYPFGLEGERIPLEARIFAVVDAYDAMTSDRPYRQATSPQEAMEEIRANAGIQFDPPVVEAFAAVLDRLLRVEQDAQAA
jgi:HD-GYP domain-containing protein (c-di-GMP phosphodiesterase class II)